MNQLKFNDNAFCSTQNKSSAEILNLFFIFLNSQALSYCVFGNTHFLPEQISSDIDIVLDYDCPKTLIQLITTFCKQEGIHWIQQIEHDPNAYHFTLAWFNTSSQMQLLHLDFYSRYIEQGQSLLSAEHFLTKRIQPVNNQGQNKTFYIPCPSISFVTYLLKRVFKENLETAHWQFLSKEYKKDKNGAQQQIRQFWPQQLADSIIQAFEEDNRYNISDKLQILKRSIRRHKSLKDTWKELQRKLVRMFRPTGLWFTVMGPDGCGKSSVIQGLSAFMSPCFQTVEHFHLKPGILRLSKSAALPITEPHSQKPRNSFTSILKLIYFVLDYGIGYFSKLHFKLAKTALIIFDRFYDDLLIDPIRFRYGGPRFLAQLCRYLTPRPDLMILLDAPPEILQDRKQEVPFEETKRQREAYLRHFKQLPNGIIIDASQPLETVIQDTAKAIISKMERRVIQRAGSTTD